MSITVTLREVQPDDLEAVHALLSDWSVVRYMLLPRCATRSETEKCLRDMLTPEPANPWHSTVRAITSADELIGLCGIEVLRNSEQGELWYLVAPSQWRKGVATQAARQLLHTGFADLNLHRLFATCLPQNPASARVLEKVGMRREGRLVANLKIHGQWQDSFLYAIVRAEWERVAPRARA